VARRQLERDKWPIDPAAAGAPVSWQGWPENKKFALVLTHDVESAVGHAKCHEVVSLEMARGFRSSFNFVLEGYNVSTDLRRYLADKGHEVGIHGVYHDGKDFKTRQIFEKRAVLINRRLKEWQSVGFRAPAMYCRHDWLKELGIEYDSSTFDTDPFELEATSVRTIFPFYVNGGPDGAGYVELPYTLPQDFTLFVLLKEKDISTWKNKLDWIAGHGGMALIITHPDYMSFNGRKAGFGKYPADYYAQFLDYANSRYHGQFWNVLPKELARFWKDNHKAGKFYSGPKRRSNLRICMPAYSFYETDNRVIRYAETLAKRGDQVDVIALRQAGQSDFQVINGVRVFRIQERVLNEKGKIDYLLRLVKFFFRSARLVTRNHLRAPYDVIHVHSIPDFEVFVALVPKLTGAKIILDIHDIVPEFYASKFGANPNGVLFKMLVGIEKLSARFCNHVIVSNHLWEKKLLKRSVSANKCSVILNYPDPAIFYQREKSRKDGKKIIMYPGSLNYHQGLDIAIRALSQISMRVPEAELHIYGEGAEKNNLLRLAAALCLDGCVKFFSGLPIEDIATAMADSDLGIVPKRNDAFGGEAFSTKILEFMSLGVPVLVSATRIDQFYFNEEVVHFFKPHDPGDLAKKLLFLLKDQAFCRTLSANALVMARNFSWDLKKGKYLSLIDSLAAPNPVKEKKRHKWRNDASLRGQG
jgi:glycosyltransferase involved in cell wall biosynthesis/peptidoglycan/xylan/chitin deacetylase (PgdA/CDA1 family)